MADPGERYADHTEMQRLNADGSQAGVEGHLGVRYTKITPKTIIATKAITATQLNQAAVRSLNFYPEAKGTGTGRQCLCSRA